MHTPGPNLSRPFLSMSSKILPKSMCSVIQVKHLSWPADCRYCAIFKLHAVQFFVAISTYSIIAKTFLIIKVLDHHWSKINLLQHKMSYLLRIKAAHRQPEHKYLYKNSILN